MEFKEGDKVEFGGLEGVVDAMDVSDGWPLNVYFKNNSNAYFTLDGRYDTSHTKPLLNLIECGPDNHEWSESDYADALSYSSGPMLRHWMSSYIDKNTKKCKRCGKIKLKEEPEPKPEPLYQWRVLSFGQRWTVIAYLYTKEEIKRVFPEDTTQIHAGPFYIEEE